MSEPVLQLATPQPVSSPEPPSRFLGQLNLFTGELEPAPIDVPDPPQPGEIQVDDGITLVKTVADIIPIKRELEASIRF